MKIELTLTQKQIDVVPDLQQYAETLANDRIARAKERKRSTDIKILTAKDDAELTALVSPIIAAEKAKLEAQEAPVEEPIEG
jgi:hypothetical protein